MKQTGDPFKKKRDLTGVLITGGGGFIGSHLAEYFLTQAVPVVCVDNFCTGMRENRDYLKNRKNAAEHLTFVEDDVTRPWGWAQNLKPEVKSKISHVFHMASPASPPLYQAMAFETMWVNTVGLKNALEFADNCDARLVFASTSEVYGDPDCSPQPESYWGNVNSFGIRSCYDESKRFGEALIYTHNLKKSGRHGLVRIFNTYGPRMNPHDGRVIINFLVQAEAGQKLTVYGDGQQTRSFCYVSDLVAGLVSYATKNIFEPVNLGNDGEFSIMQLVDVVKKIYPDKKLEVEFQPLPTDDPKQRRPDLTKARKMLEGWGPTVSLLQGLLLMRESLKR